MQPPVRFLTVACFTLAAFGAGSLPAGSMSASVHLADTGAPAPAQAPALKPLQWSLKDARAYGAWTIATTGGAGVRICSVDTGAATIPNSPRPSPLPRTR